MHQIKPHNMKTIRTFKITTEIITHCNPLIPYLIEHKMGIIVLEIPIPQPLQKILHL